jgi:hypothetical protein
MDGKWKVHLWFERAAGSTSTGSQAGSFSNVVMRVPFRMRVLRVSLMNCKNGVESIE